MQFENFPFKGPLSFVYPPDVINYVNKYADAFNLLPHIQVKFYTVSPAIINRVIIPVFCVGFVFFPVPYEDE